MAMIPRREPWIQLGLLGKSFVTLIPSPCAHVNSAYFHSASTLNFIRASISSGIADLHRPLDWGLGHVQDPELQAKYSTIVASITDSLRFMHTVGADTAGQLQTVDLFTSHEGLLLEYEQSLTRRLKRPTRDVSRDHTGSADDGRAYYNTSAHFLWVGDRTRQIDGAHVEYFRGIENPIGVKIGPTTSASDLLALLRTLNPSVEVGKITLITRYGSSKSAAFFLYTSELSRAVNMPEALSGSAIRCMGTQDQLRLESRQDSSLISSRSFNKHWQSIEKKGAILVASILN